MNGKDARGITPLGMAVGFNKLPIIKLFLEADADVELTDPKGNTALHYAAGKVFVHEAGLPSAGLQNLILQKHSLMMADSREPLAAPHGHSLS